MTDALGDLYRGPGDVVAGSRSVRYEPLTAPPVAEVMAFLRDHLSAGAHVELDGTPVREVIHRAGTETVSARDAVVLIFDDAWLSVSPIEAADELEVLGECWAEQSNRATLGARLSALIGALAKLASDPERDQTATQLAASSSLDEADIEARSVELVGGAPKALSEQQALALTIRAIDLTTLAGDDTHGRVRALCAQARQPDPANPAVGPTAAVCVYPNLVPTAVALTASSGVAVASVASAFPSGLSSLAVRLADIDDVVRAGADEVDVVINRAALLGGDDDTVLAELRAMRASVGNRSMKVILETGELITIAAIEHACRLAIKGGADWVKTSTGKSATGASPAAVLTMATVVARHMQETGEPVGIKVSGGVRTAADALGYLAVIEAGAGPEWLDPARVRFGASGLLTAVVDALREATSVP